MKKAFILFFSLDMLALIGLTYLFLQKIDNGGRPRLLVLIFLGIVLSIFLLIVFFRGYIRQSSGARKK
jgi:hypothetical protein